jgi:hypothetical protein
MHIPEPLTHLRHGTHALCHEHPAFIGFSSQPQPSSARALAQVTEDGGAAAADVVSRMKRVVERMSALEPALSRGGRGDPRGGASSLDCCSLARTHGVVPNADWGTLPSDLQLLWNKQGCNEAVGDGACRDSTAALGSSERVRELEKQLKESRAREADLTARLRKALNPNNTPSVVKPARGRQGVVMSCPHER